MLANLLSRHLVTLFLIILFALRLVSGRSIRNTETKYFWVTVVSCFLLIVQDLAESFCTEDPSLRFWRTVLSALGYTFRSTAPLGLLLAIIRSDTLRRLLWIPSIFTLVMSSTALFSDIVFGFDKEYAFYRGPLGLTVFVAPILYLVLILLITFKSFSEKDRIDLIICVLCAVFCLATSAVGMLYGGVALNEALMISGVFFYYVLFSHDKRRDPLTGLLNRQAFYDDCAEFDKKIAAVSSVDMNGLKELNDTRGHAAGDEALKKIGKCIDGVTDARTSVYRIGGDEFAILFFHADADVIEAKQAKIKQSVAACGYSVSAGYAVRKEGASVDEALTESDARMYKDKADYYKEKGVDRRITASAAE